MKGVEMKTYAYVVKRQFELPFVFPPDRVPEAFLDMVEPWTHNKKRTVSKMNSADRWESNVATAVAELLGWIWDVYAVVVDNERPVYMLSRSDAIIYAKKQLKVAGAARALVYSCNWCIPAIWPDSSACWESRTE